MNKNILLISVLILSSSAFPQSLKIYKTDQTLIDFDLTEVDSITFTVSETAESLDSSAVKCNITEPEDEKEHAAACVYKESVEALTARYDNDRTNQAVQLSSISNNPAIDPEVEKNAIGDLININFEQSSPPLLDPIVFNPLLIGTDKRNRDR